MPRAMKYSVTLDNRTLKISDGHNQMLSSVISDTDRCILMLDLGAITSSGIKMAASIADQ